MRVSIRIFQMVCLVVWFYGATSAFGAANPYRESQDAWFEIPRYKRAAWRNRLRNAVENNNPVRVSEVLAEFQDTFHVEPSVLVNRTYWYRGEPIIFQAVRSRVALEMVGEILNFRFVSLSVKERGHTPEEYARKLGKPDVAMYINEISAKRQASILDSLTPYPPVVTPLGAEESKGAYFDRVQSGADQNPFAALASNDDDDEA